MVTKEGKGEGDKLTHFYTLFPGGSDGKASACNAGDSGSILGSGINLPRSSALAGEFFTNEPSEKPLEDHNLAQKLRQTINDLTR